MSVCAGVCACVYIHVCVRGHANAFACVCVCALYSGQKCIDISTA